MNNTTSLISIIFRTIAFVVSFYTLLCFIRIIITWIPSMSGKKFTRILASVCDPYLNIFNKIKFLTLGRFNFSPALALCLLGAVSSLLSNFSSQGKISIGVILAMLISMAWSIISSLIVFLIILFLIRVIMLALKRPDYNGSIMGQIDYSIQPFVYRIAGTFKSKSNMSYKTALIISIITLFVVVFAGTFLFNFISSILANLPF